MLRAWRHELLPPLFFTLATRLVLFVTAWLSLRAVPRLDLYPGQLPDSFLPDHPFLDGWARWDAAHYIAIADLGYGNPDSPSVNGGYGFLPLFPLLLRLIGYLPGVDPSPSSYAVIGIVLANVALLVCVVLFTTLCRITLSRPATWTAITLFLLSPFSFFFSAAYSESVFLAICLGSLLLADRNRWIGAGALGGIASATRIAGLALAPALLYAAWRDGVRGWRLALAGALPFSGFAFWSIYAWWKTGEPHAYFRAQADWGGWTEHVRFYAELLINEPMTMLRGDPRHLVILLNIGLGVLFLAFLPLVWRRAPPAIAMFTIVIVVVHVGWTWVSLGRYLLPAVGVYMVAADLLTQERVRGWPRDILIASLAITLAGLAILFAHGFWVV
ncbi:MAG: hypothetical protein KF883_13410 [Thermomicrobiales bacterium]|nr:hypothetical protein [Thermomicrobiales bacterium]